jgi:hypothetical protein
VERDPKHIKVSPNGVIIDVLLSLAGISQRMATACYSQLVDINIIPAGYTYTDHSVDMTSPLVATIVAEILNMAV